MSDIHAQRRQYYIRLKTTLSLDNFCRQHIKPTKQTLKFKDTDKHKMHTEQDFYKNP